MSEILVVANRTLGGEKLLEAVRERAASGDDVSFRLVVPQSKPTAGLVIYDEAVRESAQVRIDLALSTMAGEGIKVTGEVGRRRPVPGDDGRDRTHRPDEIIVSTHPATQLGLAAARSDRAHPKRLRAAGEHVVTDLEREGLPFDVTLVIANKTSSGEELLERPAREGRRRRADRRRCSSPSYPSRTVTAHARARRARGWRRCSRSCTRRACWRPA